VSRRGRLAKKPAGCLAFRWTEEGAYFPARIFEPLIEKPNKGAIKQKSNKPATNGTMPTIATMMPIVPPMPAKPQAIKAIPATICNGFAANPQFQFKVPPNAANDAPGMFTDKDWIPHAAGWRGCVREGS
jgi:hypothetical protein